MDYDGGSSFLLFVSIFGLGMLAGIYLDQQMKRMREVEDRLGIVPDVDLVLSRSVAQGLTAALLEDRARGTGHAFTEAEARAAR